MSVGDGIVGFEEQVYVSKETAYGVFKAPVGTDAIRVISSGLTASQERVNRKDKRSSRSISDRISRKKTAEFTLSMYILPSGTAGTPPDITQALEAAFGTYTNNAGTSDVYTLNVDIDSSFTISRILSTDFSESFTGCIFDEIKMKFPGQEEASFEITGTAKEWIRTTGTTVDGATTTSLTFIVAADKHLEIGSVVKIGSNDNTGVGFEITDYDADTLVCTIGATASFGDGDVIVPFFPSATTAGQPLACFPGTISLGGVNMCVSDFEISIKNNLNPRLDCFGAESSSGYSASSYREVTFSGTVYTSATNMNMPQATEDFETMEIIVTAGDTAGHRAISSMPYAELDLVPYEVPEDGELTFTIKGVATAPAGHEEEELSLTFN